MKTAAHKAMIYDDSCPLCVMYTRAFVQAGLLEKGNRISFQELDQKAPDAQLEWPKAKHEIPLIDLEGGKTLYGLDSLVHVLGQKMPILPRLLNVQPIYWFFRRLYFLVSYNRRIIVGTGATCNTHDCTPEFNMKYRMAFILFAIGIASWISYALGVTLSEGILPEAFHVTPVLVLAAVGAGWLIDGISAMIYLLKDRVTYLGHLATTMLIGVLLLLPFLALHGMGLQTPYLLGAGVLLSDVVMLIQHRKRARLLGLGWTWTFMFFVHLHATAASIILFNQNI